MFIYITCLFTNLFTCLFTLHVYLLICLHVYLHICLHLFISTEKDLPVIHIYDGKGQNKEIAVLDKIHNSPIIFMKVN